MVTTRQQQQQHVATHRYHGCALNTCSCRIQARVPFCLPHTPFERTLASAPCSYDDPQIRSFVQQQLQLHDQRVSSRCQKHPRQSHGIIDCEDHFPNRLMWYCRCITKPSPTPSPKPLSKQPLPAAYTLRHLWLRKALFRHLWAFQTWDRVPQAHLGDGATQLNSIATFCTTLHHAFQCREEPFCTIRISLGF